MMALARVVTFEGVTDERAAELSREIEDGELPEGLPATEVIVLHDPEAETAIAILFFESDADYEQGHAVLDAMPGPDTPGRRTSVRKHHVAARRSS
jgi:hypothetical protein